MIAGIYPADVRIVRTWPGRGTGDSYYETEDGRVWHTTSSSMPPITGVTYASIVGDRMLTPPRSTGVPFYSRRPIFFRLPEPAPEMDLVSEPVPTRRPAKALQKPVVGFVGAGPMKRRWR